MNIKIFYNIYIYTIFLGSCKTLGPLWASSPDCKTGNLTPRSGKGEMHADNASE